MKAKNNNLKTLDQFKDNHYGKIGTQKRDDLDAGYENFKIGTMIHNARIEKGLTQEQLAEKTGTKKSYISRIENGKGNIQLSTLIRIFEIGLNKRIGLTFL